MSAMTLILAVLTAIMLFSDSIDRYSTLSVTLLEFKLEYGFQLWIPMACFTGLAALVDLRAGAARAFGAKEAEPPPPPTPPVGTVDAVRRLDLGVRADIRSMPGIPLVVVFDEMTPEQERRALERLFGLLATAEQVGRVRLMFRTETQERPGRLDALIQRFLSQTGVRMVANREHVDLVFSVPAS